MNNKILLIDVSNLFYRAFHAIPKTLTSPEGEPVNAVYGICSALLTLIENKKPNYIFAFRDKKEKTFRHEKDENYKSQRPPMPDELVSQLKKIAETLDAFGFPVLAEAGFEADDCIATVVHKFCSDKNNEINILSSDQDLMGLVHDNVYILKPIQGGKTEKMDRNKIKEAIGVYPEQIADFKAIAGDNSDNLAGVPGIGKKGASDLLAEFGDLETILNNINKITGRKGELLTQEKDQAIHTKKMVELYTEVPGCDVPLSEGNINKVDWEKVRDLFEKYGFNSLIKRLKKMNLISDKPVNTEDQLSFF